MDTLSHDLRESLVRVQEGLLAYIDGKVPLNEMEREFFREQNDAPKISWKDLEQREELDRKRASLFIALYAKRVSGIERALKLAKGRNLGVVKKINTFGADRPACIGMLRFPEVGEKEIMGFYQLDDKILERMLNDTYNLDYPITPGNFKLVLADSRISEVLKNAKYYIYQVGSKKVIMPKNDLEDAYNQIKKIAAYVNALEGGRKYKFYPQSKTVDLLAKILMHRYHVEVTDGGLKFSRRTEFGLSRYEKERFLNHTREVAEEFEKFIGADGTLEILARSSTDVYSLIYASIYDSGLYLSSEVMASVNFLVNMYGISEIEFAAEYGLQRLQIKELVSLESQDGFFSKVLNEVVLSINHTIALIEEAEKEEDLGLTEEVGEISVSNETSLVVEYLEENNLSNVGHIEVFGDLSGKLVRELHCWVNKRGTKYLREWYFNVSKLVCDVEIGSVTPGGWTRVGKDYIGKQFDTVQDGYLRVIVGVGLQMEVVKEHHTNTHNRWLSGEDSDMLVVTKIPPLHVDYLASMRKEVNSMGLQLRVRVLGNDSYLELGKKIKGPLDLKFDSVISIASSENIKYEEALDVIDNSKRQRDSPGRMRGTKFKGGSPNSSPGEIGSVKKKKSKRETAQYGDVRVLE